MRLNARGPTRVLADTGYAVHADTPESVLAARAADFGKKVVSERLDGDFEFVVALQPVGQFATGDYRHRA